MNIQPSPQCSLGKENHLVTLESPKVLMFRELMNNFAHFIIPRISAGIKPQSSQKQKF